MKKCFLVYNIDKRKTALTTEPFFKYEGHIEVLR